MTPVMASSTRTARRSVDGVVDGVLVSRVIYVKESGGKHFVIQDAGMNDLIRPTLYDSFHRIWPVAPAAGFPGQGRHRCHMEHDCEWRDRPSVPILGLQRRHEGVEHRASLLLHGVLDLDAHGRRHLLLAGELQWRRPRQRSREQRLFE